MKKYLKIIFLFIIIIAIYIIYNQENKTKITYISIGDGFAVGLNSYQEPSYGYDDYLKDELSQKNLLNNYYSSFSYNDMRISDLHKDLLLNAHDEDNNNIRQALRESNLLTISVGINDLIYQMTINSPLTETNINKILTEIVDNLAITIDEIKHYYKNDIYLVGYYNFYPHNSVERKILDKLNSEYKEYCTKNNIYFVDNENLNSNLDQYLDNPNSIYPNVRGYKKIYSNISSKLNY